jgi:hypothetical protein
MDMQNNITTIDNDKDLVNTYDDIIVIMPRCITTFAMAIEQINMLVKPCDILYLCEYCDGFKLSYGNAINKKIVFKMQQYGLHAITDKMHKKMSKVSTYENGYYSGDILVILDKITSVAVHVNYTYLLKHIDKMISHLNIMKNKITDVESRESNNTDLQLSYKLSS